MLTKTEVIVLKSMKYRDTSKIITFYSKEFGKVSGIAKGARSSKNKFSSSLEPMTHSMLLIYKKEHKDLHLISQCDAIQSFQNILTDLNRTATALAVIELIDRVTHHEEHNDRLFLLLIETLNALNSKEKNYAIYLQAFKLRLVALFGYTPDFDSCNKCGKSLLEVINDKSVTFQISRGAVFCERCYDSKNISTKNQDHKNNVTKISVQGLHIIHKLLNASWQTLNNLKFNINVGNEIDELISLYLQYHFDGLKNLKSMELLQKYN